MKTATLSRFLRSAPWAVLLGLMLFAAGCDTKLNPLLVVNQLPEVRLTSAPIDTTSKNFYSVTLNWVGHDVDGRVDHYLYAIDPPEQADAETTWVLTRDNERRQNFSAAATGPAPDTTRSRDFHTFVILAVDNLGARGPRVNRDFYSYTVAPTVRIEIPRPSTLSTRLLTPSVRITWSGQDPDGVFSTRPLYYKYRLFNVSSERLPGGEDASEVISRPWLIRHYYAPEFSEEDDWIRTSSDTNFAQFTSLNPGNEYAFVVVGFDEAGAHTPTFSLDTNVLKFRVGYAGTRGPIITMFNEFFFYRYPGGSYTSIPSAWINIEVPADQPIRFNWFAEPPDGAEIRSYRWMLDGDVSDETARTDEGDSSQFNFWSARSRNTQSAVVGPFTGGEHFFYLEAEDNIGLRSLGIVHFYPVRSSLERPLMVVNDTRFKLGRSQGGYYTPLGTWPEQAEFDTFMFAYGGWPWQTRQEGIESTPGLLKGYPFSSSNYPLGDIFKTRIGRRDLTVPLSVLGHYQHVLWLIDGVGANNLRFGTDPQAPMTALRYMSEIGRVNTLAAYVKQGGRVWVAGGGGAMASTGPYDENANNIPTVTFSSNTPSQKEVRPGRFMYDLAKWQSEYRVASSSSIPVRYLGRYDPPGNRGIYALLPDSLEIRTPATDMLPPGRNATDFYQTHSALEFLQKENIFTEALRTDPIDFQIENFGYATSPDLRAVWRSSDSVNTVAVSGANGSNGRGMLIQTQGGGGSNGDRVRRTFGSLRDWSGLTQFRFAVRQDQPVSSVQWRVRIIDRDGGSLVANVPWAGGAGYQTVSIPLYGFTSEVGRVPSLTYVAAIEFELARGDAAGSSEFDQISISATFDTPVLDTLYVARGGGNSGLPAPADNPHNVIMTYYHGHDSTPFVFTGFSLWSYKRAQLSQLVDFVFQRMWGLNRDTVSPALRSSRPVSGAGQAGGGVNRRGATPLSRPAEVRRTLTPEPGTAGALRPNRGTTTGK